MLAPRVVILGSGFAGLETAFLLRSKLDKADVDITVVSDRDDFLFKPNMIYLPFGAAEKPLHVPLQKAFFNHDIHHRIGHVENVHAERSVVHTSRGLPIHYDKLVIATGAAMNPDEIPGLREFARTIWAPGQMHKLGEDLQWVAQHARHGRHQNVLFLVPPGNKCAGPLYEIAFMLDIWLHRKGVRHQIDITFTTCEPAFIQAFGPKVRDVVVEEFAIRRITGHTGVAPEKVTETEVVYTDGETRQFDLLISFPPYIAAKRYEGLPADDRGFLTCEPETRAVVGHPDIFAPGDAGDFPVKQAFLALLQADAVASKITADITGRTPQRLFEPTSMCVMEMLDRATFAQVPLRLTDDPDRPVTVDLDSVSEYRVGTGATWRLGKKALGTYLPARFRHGLPFHAGAGWRVMETGLRAGARLLAH
ncbi:NADH dehydrogenase FAD-containing subunit [Kibdelosporangium banguiense]|uniref:NADH dehydrogenase FAD-containing subunit n=1 Tax=Kibdelosporangium banguiense TaxID=1365924 RepID=A0ABS4TWK5_9PSEU|nr:FAD-dependent oxidoreductase [Kibdelosporangium banguiense]MBP2328780.1 NADH dehydrogenase FAD-containing subunit [Kibdelosporangium banguiense]